MRYRKEKRAREARKAYVYIREKEQEKRAGVEGRRSERIAFAYCARGLPRIMPD